jgi:hypothetical protein
VNPETSMNAKLRCTRTSASCHAPLVEAQFALARTSPIGKRTRSYDDAMLRTAHADERAPAQSRTPAERG